MGKGHKRGPDLCDGPSSERRQHDLFSREVLTPLGAPIVARHRVRTILTPLYIRRAILEDIAQKPPSVRVRSLRRQLTVLDRALSDREAEMLDRLVTCINGLTNIRSLDLLNSEIRGDGAGRLPFGEGKRREIEAASYVMKRLGAKDRSAVVYLAAQLDPKGGAKNEAKGEAFIAAVRSAAEAVVALYDKWSEGRKVIAPH